MNLPLLDPNHGWLAAAMACNALGDSYPDHALRMLRTVAPRPLRAASESLVELSEREIHRTYWDKAFQPLAWIYHYVSCRSGKPTTLMAAIWSAAFPQIPGSRQLEIITSAALRGASVLRISSGMSPQLRCRRDHTEACSLKHRSTAWWRHW